MDLLIAFPDRVAVCEIKRGLGTANLAESVAGDIEQTRSQVALVKEHLGRLGLDNNSTFPFLWATRLEVADLEAIANQLRVKGADYDITPTGAKSSLRGVKIPALSDSIPAYLPEALRHRLEGLHGSHRKNRIPICDALVDVIGGSYFPFKIPLPIFADFESVKVHLRDYTSHNNVQLMLDTTHVVGLHGNAVGQALESLWTRAFVEILGPHGIGKTWFTKELLGILLGKDFPYGGQSYSVVSCVLVQCSSVREIFRAFVTQAGLRDAEETNRLDEDALFEVLNKTEAVFIIPDYDLDSRTAVQLLIERLSQVRGETSGFWIIESVAADRDTTRTHQVRLNPLDNGAMWSVLQRKPGTQGRDLNEIIAKSGGLPRIAVRLLNVRDLGQLPKESRLDQYDLFIQSLDFEEREVVPALAYILAESPLGTTLQLVEEWCRSASLPSANIARTTRSVIEQAQGVGFIDVEIFGSHILGAEGTAETLVPAQETPTGEVDLLKVALPRSVHDALIGWIRIRDPHFVTHFTARIGEDVRLSWQQNLQSALLNQLHTDRSLTGVTLSLLTADIQPFIRSSFRSSSGVLPRLLQWSTTKRDPYRPNEEPTSSYFIIWLKWLIDHYWDTTAEFGQAPTAGLKLASPDVSDLSQSLMFATFQTRGAVYWTGQDYDWASWSDTAERFRKTGEIDLWAEALLRQAQSRLRAPYNDVESAWKLFLTVLNEEDKLSDDAGRSQLYFHVLSFFNKRKLLATHLPELLAQAKDLRPTLIRKMIRDGLVMENINSIANALFFLFRPLDVESRARDVVDLESRIAIMQFVQRISPARQIQALLTEGSIHRYYCSQNRIVWDEFRDHADDALRIYRTVFGSAGSRRMITNAANALSYSGLLLFKAFRFRDVPHWSQWFQPHAARLLSDIEKFLKETPSINLLDDDMGELDRSILRNVHKYRALLTLVLKRGRNSEEYASLKDYVIEALSLLRETTQSVSRQQRLGVYIQATEEINRAIGFSAENPDHIIRMGACAPGFIELLGDSKTMLPRNPDALRKSDLRQNGERILQLLAATEATLPEDLRREFSRPIVPHTVPVVHPLSPAAAGKL